MHGGPGCSTIRAMDPVAVRALLRESVFPIVLGVLIITIGLAAAAVGARQRPRPDASLLTFAVLAVLYGARLALETGASYLALGAPDETLHAVAALLTYALPLPGLRLLDTPAMRRRQPIVARLWQVWLPFAAVAIGVEAGLGHTDAIHTANNVMVLLGLPLILVGFYPTLRALGTDSRMMLTATGLFVAGAAADNVRGLGVDWWPGGLESVGAAIFIATLGWVLARQYVERHDRLVAIERDLDVARRIQQSLLPRTLPRRPGVDLAAHYAPMEEVAGDLYDVVETPGGGIGLLIADVTGHGVPAALIASMVKTGLAAQRTQADDPSAVLEGLNRLLSGAFERHFVTAAYVWIAPGASRLRAATAGHPPPRLVRDGAVRELATGGTMLGFDASQAFPGCEVALKPGDRLVLFTDGIIEAEDAHGDAFGLTRLDALLCRAGGQGADALIGALRSAVDRWVAVPGRFGDDITLVAVALSGSLQPTVAVPAG